MKKRIEEDDEMKAHYDFSKGVRGRFAGMIRKDAPVMYLTEEESLARVAKLKKKATALKAANGKKKTSRAR